MAHLKAGPSPPRPSTPRIVLGADDEADSAAVRFAFQKAADRHAPLHLVGAWRCPALVVASGTADLLFVGARRRRGHLGLQLGRSRSPVLHHSPCPVAIVPQRTSQCWPAQSRDA
ncbi:universal stress protein [Streptomyces flavofungini]|uniref:Universal stress protein n=1 Tax=Streptomyces flavofungini TaxID=68200 RepID=A0ABS0XI30_9ACTN|nr:universal stress protein [Streptomyces flavofungini]